MRSPLETHRNTRNPPGPHKSRTGCYLERDAKFRSVGWLDDAARPMPSPGGRGDREAVGGVWRARKYGKSLDKMLYLKFSPAFHSRPSDTLSPGEGITHRNNSSINRKMAKKKELSWTAPFLLHVEFCDQNFFPLTFAVGKVVGLDAEGLPKGREGRGEGCA